MKLYQAALMLLPLLTAAAQLATALVEWRTRKDEQTMDDARRERAKHLKQKKDASWN